MTKKRLCKFSLTGFQCLVFYKLIQQGKRIILVGDNKFKVVDDNEKEDYDRIVDLLNDLSAENEELKKRNEFLKKRCNEY